MRAKRRKPPAEVQRDILADATKVVLARIDDPISLLAEAEESQKALTAEFQSYVQRELREREAALERKQRRIERLRASIQDLQQEVAKRRILMEGIVQKPPGAEQASAGSASSDHEDGVHDHTWYENQVCNNCTQTQLEIDQTLAEVKRLQEQMQDIPDRFKDVQRKTAAQSRTMNTSQMALDQLEIELGALEAANTERAREVKKVYRKMSEFISDRSFRKSGNHETGPFTVIRHTGWGEGREAILMAHELRDYLRENLAPVSALLTDDELRSANAERALKSEQIAGELQEIAKDAVKAESMLKNVNGPLLLALQNVAQSYNLVATKRALRAKAGTGDARPGETRDSKAKERWSGEAMEMLAEDKSAEAGSALFEKVSAFLESLSARTYEATEHLKSSHNPDLIDTLDSLGFKLAARGTSWIRTGTLAMNAGLLPDGPSSESPLKKRVTKHKVGSLVSSLRLATQATGLQSPRAVTSPK